MDTTASVPYENLPHPIHTSVILESIADGVFTVDLEWRITSFNRAAEVITGVTKEHALGQQCADVFNSTACESACPIRQAMETGAPVIGRLVDVFARTGKRVPVSVSSAVLKDEKGHAIGGAEIFRDLSQVEELRKKLEGGYCCEDIVSRSRRMRDLFEVLPMIALSQSTVLIQGESGSGKELVARAIHNLSPRKSKPFVAVNCGALPDTLLESELFGYKKGAFTGAGRDKPGRFALAEKGTLFLDEIGDVTPAMQIRLLRVLQERSYEPLGGTESVAADVRVIVASNRGLGSLVEKGEFRKDLYYRINVVQVDLPLLQERKEDIPLLLEHFVNRYNHLQGKDVAGVSDEALALFMAYDYPGNVRELENAVEHAFVLCSSGLIEPRHLPKSLASSGLLRSAVPEGRTLKDLEKFAILDALRRHGWSRKEAAQELGLHKSTFFRKIKAYAIELPDRRAASSASPV